MEDSVVLEVVVDVVVDEEDEEEPEDHHCDDTTLQVVTRTKKITKTRNIAIVHKS